MRIKQHALKAINTVAAANPISLLIAAAIIVVSTPIAIVGAMMAADVTRVMFAGVL